jgi:hypothetical protein
MIQPVITFRDARTATEIDFPEHGGTRSRSAPLGRRVSLEEPVRIARQRSRAFAGKQNSCVAELRSREIPGIPPYRARMKNGFGGPYSFV